MSASQEFHEGAFIGISLDSKKFTRTWIAGAIAHALGRHDRLKLVVADDLLTYTRTTLRRNAHVVLDIDAVRRRCERRYTDMTVFLRRSIDRLPAQMAARVSVTRFRECVSPDYSSIHRFLLIAYHSASKFEASVSDTAAAHRPIEGNDRLNALFLLDEMAMCIALGELGGYRHEYSPYEQIRPLQELYAGAFVDEGLSVQALTGAEPRREFATL